VAEATPLAELLTGGVPSAAQEDVDGWWAMHTNVVARHPDTAGAALVAGFTADRPGWAFASGYQAALRALVPALSPGRRVALAVTEEGGNHPRAIATSLEAVEGGVRLDGEKAFVTLGTHADALLVVATRGLGDDGRPRLVVAQVPTDAEGVALEELPGVPFVPEIPHARAILEGVVVAEGAVHPGDGYADYVKPFRTVEDAHVHAALVGWFLRLSRLFDTSAELRAELATLASTLHRLCRADPRDPTVHVLLAGALSHVSQLAFDPRLWEAVDDDTRALWERDRPILKVAERARKARLERAVLTLGR